MEAFLDTEKRSPPADPALREAARNTPGGWVYEIDGPNRPDAYTPPEAVKGGWRVDVDGELTGEYAPNPSFRPIQRLDRKLPRYMTAGARFVHDEWIAEIAPAAEHLFPDVPHNQKVGFWYVNSSGVLTDMFRANSKFEPGGSMSG